MGTYALTGGSSGFGAAIANQLSAEGHTIINIDLKTSDITADLSTVDGRQQAIDAVHEMAPDGLDGFVPLAGIGGAPDNNTAVCKLNYFGTVRLVQGLIDLIAKKRGVIVLLSSNSAFIDFHGEALIESLLTDDESAALEAAQEESIIGEAYMISKLALLHWMRENTADFAQKGVRINAVAPGIADTPMTVKTNRMVPDIVKQMIEDTPLKRLGQPEEIANCIRFLLGPQSNFVCGSVLVVDGGFDAQRRPRLPI